MELGRVDMYLEVSVLSQYLASPRQGHLKTAYHLFAYLKAHPQVKFVFDPTEPHVNERPFEKVDRTEACGGVVEELPARCPKPHGNSVIISCFVDANHAGNCVTQRSHTGILTFVNNAPVLFHSKQQNTVETSAFGSKLVAMQIAKEMIFGLRHKLQMFSVLIEEPADVYCNDQGAVKNTSFLESTLSKKHNDINCHAVHKACAAGIMRVAKDPTETNLADLFTKPLIRLHQERLLACIVWGSFAHEKWWIRWKQKNIKDRAAS